jgi:hypothetical protein
VRPLRGASRLAAVALLLLTTIAAAPPPAVSDLQAHVQALTAPEMEGRGSGTAGGDRAARYIAAALARTGLRPGGDGGTFFQEFTLGESPSVGPASRLAPGGAVGRDLALGQAWTPHGGSATGGVSAEIVVVAGGDYAAADVGGRIALAPAETPGAPGRRSRLEHLIAARRAGARGLLLVEDALPTVSATAAPVALLSGSVTRAGAAALLGRSLDQVIGPAAAGGVVLTGIRADLHVELRREPVRAANVIGVLPGTDPARADEAVVIGAHYDHLGRAGAAVYPGADDNASGTAVALELARTLAAGRPSRTLVFVFFAGEELGLLGASHYVRQPSAGPLQRIAAMLNFDMVGRLDGRRLLVGGVDTGAGLRPLVEAAGAQAGLDLDLRGGGWGASDHARFYGADVPVLFFHSGAHGDYHQPSDTADKLDLTGMARVAALGAALAARIADGPRPVFARVPESAPRSARGASGPAGSRPDGAFLGIGADVRAGWDGVLIGSIVPGSAAERAGLRPGDVLVQLAGAGLHGFPELREQLGRRRPGETVAIVYLREGLDHETRATLGPRP